MSRIKSLPSVSFAALALALSLTAGPCVGGAWGRTWGSSGGSSGGQEAGKAGGDTAAPATRFSEALRALSPDEAIYFQHAATLANPIFEGRAPGLRGNELAAEYVEFYFRRFGLEPLFPSEATETAPARTGVSFRQPFQAGARFVVAREELVVGETSLSPSVNGAGGDFTVMPQSGDGAVEGEVVFVGYSIEKGQEDYSSYFTKDGKDAEGADLAGKIAMVLRFEPMNAEGKTRWGENGVWTGNSTLVRKMRAAVQRGAQALIIVSPPGASDPRADKLDDIRSGSGPGARRIDVPVLMMSRASADRLCKAAGHDLAELTRTANEHGGVTSLAKAGKARVGVEIKREPTVTSNVAGVLRGRGALAEQYLIIGGHYDHVGMGAFGSRDPAGNGKLHPGADDNASGTSGVLLAAQKLAGEYAALPPDANVRSIIFMCFSAEESGLVGSAWFVRTPPIGAASTYAMLNMDMIGRLREKTGLEVSGVGSAEGFADVLKPLFDKAPFKVRTLPGGMGPSDHASFYRAGVPVLHFFTGLHDEYHMPTDVYTTINTTGAVQVVDLLIETARTLAGRTEPLTFTQAKGPSITMDQPGRAQREGPAPVRVRVGIAPANYSDDLPGVPVGDVFDGTSAADAGIKKGDRLIRWNGEEIKGVEEWMGLLRAAKVGDIVQVVVVREKEELTLPMTLKARETGDR